MPHPLLDPRRLAMLHALGLEQAWVPRDALDPAELAALLPPLPGAAAAPTPQGRRAQVSDAPGATRGTPARDAPPAATERT
ncbi:MAG: hypothetical protein KGR99_16425, partial [Betaproteobacteria bacterium]|nr:hypothetical protein [Betaproteobacteria bacterium]